MQNRLRAVDWVLKNLGFRFLKNLENLKVQILGFQVTQIA